MKEAMQWHEIRRMMALNGNLFVRSLCFMVVYVGFTTLASRYGDTELAVSSILMKLFMFFSYFSDGFAYAGEALVGKEFGQCTMHNAQCTESIRHTVRALFRWSIGIGIVFTAVYGLWGNECIGLLTNDGEVLGAADKFIGWLIAMPIVSALAFMWDGIYVGATAGKQIRNAMIWAAAGFVIAYYATSQWVGVQALYIAYFAHLAARVIYLSLKYETILVYPIMPDGSDELSRQD